MGDRKRAIAVATRRKVDILSVLRAHAAKLASAPWTRAIATAARRVALPPGFVVAAAPLVIAALMTWVFALGNEDSPLAYAAYVASAYLLAVLCIWVVRHFPRQGVRGLASRFAVTDRVLNDKEYRRRLSVLGGLVVDAAWAAANLAGGMYFASAWLVTLGAWYLLCALMRGALLHRMVRARRAGRNGQRGIARLCGALLLASTVVLSGIVILVMHGKGTFSYQGTLIYAVAAFAFYSLIIAIVNGVRLRGHVDVLVVLNCRINLAVALVSIFALEVAMLAEFGTASDAQLSFIAPILTGAAIACALVALGLRSILSARK